MAFFSPALSVSTSSSSAMWLAEKKRKSNECIADFDRVEKINAHKGDLIEIKSCQIFNFSEKISDQPKGAIVPGSFSLYEHWTVYIGEGEVIHLVNLGRDSKGLVREEKLTEVVEGNLCRVNNLLKGGERRGLQWRPSKEVVKFAYSMLDEEIFYSALTYNCEHFATECLYGKAFSQQVENIPIIGAYAKTISKIKGVNKIANLLTRDN